jgi:hypothetical protein
MEIRLLFQILPNKLLNVGRKDFFPIKAYSCVAATAGYKCS